MFGFLVNILLGIFLVLYYFDLVPLSYGAEVDRHPPPGVQQVDKLDFSALNVRLSTRAIQPPNEVVARTVPLSGFRGARPMFGDPVRAAILEDDARHRVLILSTAPHDAGNGPISAYLLQNFDLESRLPRLAVCAQTRGCAQDRTPGTGGVGCIAVCLAEVLRH